MHIQDARLSMSEISSRRGWLVRGGDGVEEEESGEGSNPAGWRAKGLFNNIWTNLQYVS